MKVILSTKNLTKHYGRITAINQLNIKIKKGEVYGLLGPNGSGKTTTLAIVTGIIEQDEGTFSWFERGANASLRRRIGSIVETPNFYPYLSIKDNLKIAAEIKGISVNDMARVLEITHLSKRLNSRFNTLSYGLKQRVGLASSLLGDPDVLVFDEPTNGLDPEGIAEVRNIIIQEAKKGKTIILASHILDEVEKVCSHVAILKEGNLLAAGPVHELLTQDDTILVRADDLARLESFIKKKELSKWMEQENSFLKLALKGDLSSADFNRLAFENGITLDYLEVRKPDLESQFLELVK
mgnify:CR=1 FL=1